MIVLIVDHNVKQILVKWRLKITRYIERCKPAVRDKRILWNKPGNWPPEFDPFKLFVHGCLPFFVVCEISDKRPNYPMSATSTLSAKMIKIEHKFLWKQWHLAAVCIFMLLQLLKFFHLLFEVLFILVCNLLPLLRMLQSILKT